MSALELYIGYSYRNSNFSRSMVHESGVLLNLIFKKNLVAWLQFLELGSAS